MARRGLKGQGIELSTETGSRRIDEAGPDDATLSEATRGPAMRSGSLIESFRHAFRGLWYALRTQRNVRIHSVAAVVVLGLAIVLGVAPVELVLLVVAITLVLVAELANTALEAAVDLAAPYIDPLAQIAKDVAAAAVLTSAIAAVVIGVLVLGPHLLALLGW